MTFKLYGYRDENSPVIENAPLELEEVTLVANSIELRKIAGFLLYVAESIESKGDGWEHEHLSEKRPEFIGAPGFVVYNSSLVREGKYG
jgi:hypothetical protein